MYSRPSHEKIARFHNKVRPHDAIVFYGKNKKPISRTSNPRRRQRTNEKYHIGCQKLKWVPISRESHIESRDGTKHDSAKSIAAEGTGLHDDLEPIVHIHSEKAVVPTCTSESVDASGSVCARGSVEVGGTVVHGLTISGHHSVDGSGSVQRRDVDREEKGLDHIRGASSCTSQKTESASMHTDPVMRSISSGKRFPPMGFRPSTSTSTQGGGSASRGSLKNKASNVYDQQRVFSAKQGIFASRTAVRQCRPRNSGGNKIKSVAPGTKPGPQWCPTGLTHTQKRRVQRLRALEIREEIAKKKRDELFNRDKPMVPKMTWMKKRIMADENINVDDTIVDEILENNNNAPTDMDVDQGR
jgi:hypothetical protein